MKNSTNKILTIAVVLLLLANITMVIFIIKGKKNTSGGPPRINPLEKFDKDLNMTDQQKTEIKKLRDDHFARIRPLSDSIRAAKSAFFALVKDQNVTDSILDLYGKRIFEKQNVVDKLTFAHLRSVRALLDSEQQIKFDEFVQKMVQRNGKKRDSTENKK